MAIATIWSRFVRWWQRQAPAVSTTLVSIAAIAASVIRRHSHGHDIDASHEPRYCRILLRQPRHMMIRQLRRHTYALLADDAVVTLLHDTPLAAEMKIRAHC